MTEEEKIILKNNINKFTKEEAINKLYQIMKNVDKIGDINFIEYEGEEGLYRIIQEFICEFFDNVYNIIKVIK
jgi:hypothetical protein